MTASLEEYLKTIYILINNKSEARVTDIATTLGYSKASVNQALKALSNLEYINYQTYKEIKITPKGIEMAENIIKKHNVIKAFLMQILEIDESTAEIEAKNMKYAVSENTINKFSEYIKTIIKVEEVCSNYSPEKERCMKCIKIQKYKTK